MIDKILSILPVIFPLILSGVLTSLFSWRLNPEDTWYKTLPKAPYAPPSWLFGVVWPILYLMMGVAHQRIVKETGSWWSVPSIIYLLHLLTNVTWSGSFFGLQRPDLGFYHIVAVGLLLLLTMWFFNKVDPTAALLLVPYLAWTTFATYLSGYIYTQTE